MKTVWKPWWSGEPTVLGFLKATNDALDWNLSDKEATRTGYGVHALIRETEAFLAGYKPKPHDCPCELCCAGRTLQQNVERLKEIMHQMRTLLLFLLLAPKLFAQTITMGETNVLPFPDSGDAGAVWAQSATLIQGATLARISFFVRVAGGNATFGVYDSSGPNGGPGKLLAQTPSTSVSATGWMPLGILPNVFCSPGMYWLAFEPSSNTMGFWYDTSVGQIVAYNKAYGPLDSTFSLSPGTFPGHWSFYATLQVNPSPTPTPAPSPTATPSPTPGPSSRNVAWNAPSTLTGYRVFWGTVKGGPYPNSLDAGSNLNATLTPLQSGTTYYAVVESYDVNGALSCPTNEITFVAP